ncbi:TPR-like protein, partial [Choiromyces venosus 120613-1]
IVPYGRNRTFTGRNSIIESVKGHCRSKDHNRVSLQGLGGCGKTQIALEYVYQRAQESGCHVFWTHGSGMLKFIQDFRTIGQRVHIPQASTQKDEEQFLLRIKAWFEGSGSGDWILVIDNADNEDDFLNNNSPIAKLVPQGNKGTVIFTTRSLKVARRQECTVIEVEKMAGEEAREELFSKRFRNWDRLEDEEQKILDHSKLTALRVVSRLFPRDKTEWRYGGITAAYVPHALAVTKESTNLVAENLISLMGRYFLYIGFYGESEAMFHRALEGFEKVFGPDHPDTLTTVNNLASVLKYRGRHGESEAMSRRALEGLEKVLGPDHPHTLASVNNLALVLGPDHPDTLASVNNLASVLKDLGRHGESETMFRRALEGLEKVLGPDHPDTLTSVNNLALVLKDLGRHGESETMFRRALEGKEKVLGPDHPDTLTSVNNLALVLKDLGRHGESEAIVCNLAGVLEDQGKYDESEKMWARAMEAREKSLGQEHDEVYKTLNRLAGLYEKQRKYSQAEGAYERASTGFSKTLGEQHPTTLECIRKLTELRETKSAAERTSAIDAEVVVNDVNNRRSLHDRSRRFMELRERRGLGGGKSGKRR